MGRDEGAAPRLVCILAVGRSGTNHLATLLDSVPEIDSRRELFNPRQSYHMRREELAELAHRTRADFPLSSQSRKAVRVICRRPDLVMDCLVDHLRPQKRVLSFKVLSSQLSVRQIRNAILKRPDTLVVFLRRRPIDSFISRRKAQALQRWTKVDTTDLKIEIDAADFLKWWRRSARWYRRLEAACWRMGKPVHYLSYEDDIDIAPEQAVRRFCAMLERSGVADFSHVRPAEQIKGLARQDRTTDVRERVGNWPEFERRLAELGALDKATRPIPRFAPNWWDRLCRRLRG